VTDFAAIFVAHAPPASRPTASDVAPLLVQAIGAARATWPEIEIDQEEFVRWLAERVEQVPPTFDHAADLYLACATALGNESALAAFEPYLERARGALPRAPNPAAFADEVLAVVREKLFVGGRDGRPKIADYAGRSELGSWVRVVIARVGLDLLRRQKPGRERGDDLLAALPSTDDDPELAYLKERYGEAFRSALRDATKELSVRDRNFLRQHHVDGLKMDDLARLYDIHRVTAVRRMVAARQALANRTRQLLEARLGVDPRELESILRLVRSQLHLTLSGILRETQP